MLFFSRSHAQKKELQNIIKIIEEHYLISIGAISFKYCSGQLQPWNLVSELALPHDHAENPVEFYIVQAIEAHNLCNFGAISSKQWKVIAISVSEPRFYVGELRHVFKSLLNSSVQVSKVPPKFFTFFGVTLIYLDGRLLAA